MTIMGCNERRGGRTADGLAYRSGEFSPAMHLGALGLRRQRTSVGKGKEIAESGRECVVLKYLIESIHLAPWRSRE